MKPLYTQELYDSVKSTYNLPCECYNCGETFYKPKKEIKYFLKGNPNRTIQFCSHSCAKKYKSPRIPVECSNCKKQFNKKQSEIKKTNNNFCSLSCSATYNNKHKSFGIKRSKLELFIQEQLTLLYPNLEIHYNQKSAINSELDIYIPSLNIAFELNGIFHYEPIFGVDKLQKTQLNDLNKSILCLESKIDLCIINTSNDKYFKQSTNQKYLDIVTNIIKERILTS